MPFTKAEKIDKGALVKDIVKKLKSGVNNPVSGKSS